MTEKAINGDSYSQVINIISDKYTPYIRYNKAFPINYFTFTEKI